MKAMPYVAAVLCLLIGWFARMSWTEFVQTPVNIEASEDRAQQASDSVATLLHVVDSLDAELRISEGLSLAIIAQFKAERARFDELYPRIRSADARALHRLADSLLAGYPDRRTRYRLLLDSAGAGTR